MMSSSTGSLQGCLLSLFLYILYTDDFRSKFKNRNNLKFAADSIIVRPTDTGYHYCRWDLSSSINILAPSLTAISPLKETRTWFIGIINSGFSVCANEYFHDDRSLMRLFYKFYIESALTFYIYCWFGGLDMKPDVHWLN